MANQQLSRQTRPGSGAKIAAVLISRHIIE
jgi:hypothetical protein